MRFAGRSNLVADLKVIRRRFGLAASSRRRRTVVRMRTHGRVVVVVLVVGVTVGAPQPVGSFVSSTPSGRIAKSGLGQSTSSAPRSGAAPVNPSFTFGRRNPASTATEAGSGVAAGGGMLARNVCWRGGDA